MTGNICVKGVAPLKYMDFKQDEAFPPRFCKFEAAMDNGTQFAFADGRRLARIKLVDDPFAEAPIKDLGFDPLLDMAPLDEFSRLIKKRAMAIKNLLLDQSFSAGIGNWVADELSGLAKIHPSQYTQTLTDLEIKDLHESITSVVKVACDANADSDLFPKTWLFHYRWFKGKRSKDKVAVMPDGNPIEFETTGGRTSAIVPAVQILRLKEGQVAQKKKTANAKKEKKGKKVEEEEEEDGDSNEEEVEEKPKKSSSKRKVPSFVDPSKPILKNQDSSDDSDDEVFEQVKPAKKRKAPTPRK
ncbi:UNVERIFIED_CONTAM: hypothetical protein HDU68_003713 [Siphonaria sp. JEL0065]|nr:hypothetical protein HDU68_003713 [Siphonaria sp. JEL0065]